MNKIAIYGGSFDPPHNGHISVIKEALKLKIDKLIIVPAYISPFKDKTIANGNLRLKWMKEIVKTLNSDKIIVNDFEIKQKKKVTTYETIMHLKSIYNYKTAYIIIGADNLQNLNKWSNYDLLCKEVEFIIAKRDNIGVQNHMVLDTNINISSTMLKLDLYKNIEMIPAQIKDEIKKIYEAKR